MTDLLASLDALSITVLALVTAQRLAELVYARRNEARLIARGAIEHGAEHFPFIVGLHAAWLGGLWLLVSHVRPDPAWLTVFAILQLLRLWILATLGPRWTTRIIVLPGAQLVRAGPYKFLSHPNYSVVAAEIFVLPMAYGLPVYAAVFSLLNAAVLIVRIRAEDAALLGAANAPRDGRS